MAIDTAAKRFSIANFGIGDDLTPIPDGTLDAGDRLHLLGLYSGFIEEPPDPPAPAGSRTESTNRAIFTMRALTP